VGFQYILESKAPSTPATVSKQHCRMLQVERFFRQSRNKLNMFIVEHVQFASFVERKNYHKKTHSTLLPKTATMSMQHSTFVERAKFYDKIVRHCCRFLVTKSNVASKKSNVASALLLVWTRLKRSKLELDAPLNCITRKSFARSCADHLAAGVTNLTFPNQVCFFPRCRICFTCFPSYAYFQPNKEVFLL